MTELKTPVKYIHVTILPNGRMSRQHAARYLGCTVETVKRWTDAGMLPAVKVGGRYQYRLSDLDNFGEEEV